MIKGMAMAMKDSLTATFTKETTMMARHMEKAYINGLMEKFMMENG